MKVGTKVEIVQPVLRGTVKERRIVNDEIELLVEWDEGGQLVSRWMAADQIKTSEVQG